MNLNDYSLSQRRLMGNHGLSFKTRCLYELDVRQSRRKQQRNDLLLLSGVVAFAAFAVAIAAAIVS
jgi:hypothetical protein